MPDTDPTAPIIPPSEAEQSYLRLKPTLDAVDLADATLRGVSVEAVTRRLMALRPEYEAMIPALTAHFKVEVMDPYRAAVAALPDLVAALFHVDTMTRSAQIAADAEQADAFKQLLAQLKDDRAAALKTLSLLEQLHIISSAQADHIRAGSGYFDTAQDAVALGGIFDAHWAKVSALQALLEDASLRFTPERVLRLKDNGALLLKRLAASPADPVQLERHRLALRVLIEQRWTAIRRPARFHLELADPDRVSLYAPLRGIR